MFSSFKFHLTKLLIVLVLLSMVLSACGSATSTPNPTATTVATVAPTKSLPSPTAAPLLTPTAVATSNPTATAAPTVSKSELGSELKGQMLALKYDTDMEFNLRVIETLTFDKITTSSNQSVNPKGAFLVIRFEIVNLSKYSLTDSNFTSVLALLDSRNQKYEYAPNTASSLNRLDETKYRFIQAQPGTVNTGFMVFDLPKDTTGLKLAPSREYYESKRTATADSFKVNIGEDSGAGQEMNGTLVAIAYSSRNTDLDIRINEVVRAKEFKKGNKVVTANGVFLVVRGDVANIGKVPNGVTGALGIENDKGQVYDTLEYFSSNVGEVLRSIDATKYAYNQQVPPGFVRPFYVAFDIPQDAKGLKLVGGKYNTTTRKPSAESFTINANVADSAAGQELVGMTVENNKDSHNMTAKVTKVVRTDELKKAGKTVSKTDGVYLIVFFDVENKASQDDYFFSSLRLKDGNERQFTTPWSTSSTDLDDDYPDNSSKVKAGQTATKYYIFELTKDAKNLKFEQ